MAGNAGMLSRSAKALMVGALLTKVYSTSNLHEHDPRHSMAGKAGRALTHQCATCCHDDEFCNLLKKINSAFLRPSGKVVL